MAGDLTEHFSVSEFRVSSSRPDLAAEMVLKLHDQIKAYYLCALILQPLRDRWGWPIEITSGMRSPNLNSEVGGSSTSDHLWYMEAVACDFKFLDDYQTLKHLSDVFNWLKQHRRHLYGQMILYLKADRSPQHIHISLPTKRNLSETYIKVKGQPLTEVAA